MPSLLETIFNPAEAIGTSDINATLGFSSINAAAGSAAAYLTATIEATTPEVRRLFGEYLTQSLIGHEGLTALALKKGWVNPYESPEEQLKASYQGAEKAVTGQVQQ